ncbi:MAG: sulfur carrier protein ThiS [Acidimicrobiia bacterium]
MDLVNVNGSAAPLPVPATVAALVAALGGAGPSGIAVALNGAVVPRSAWDATALHPGDRVEVLTAAQGG